MGVTSGSARDQLLEHESNRAEAYRDGRR
jgi:hypothetical protein